MAIELKIEKKDLSESDELLIQKCLDNTKKYKIFGEEQRSRLEIELNTIINMGFSDYFLIVQDFLDVGRRVGYMPDERIEYLKEHVYEMSIKEMNDYINADQSYPGLTIGPGRGSAVGSIVSFLLGITSVEPLSNGLLFERFLNVERVSMPDIDSDLSKSEYEYGVRDIVIEYVSKKYGKNAICGITTPSTLGAKSGVRNLARIAGARVISEKSLSKQEAETVKKKYLDLAANICAKIPNDPNTTFKQKVEGEKTLGEYLLDYFKDEPEATQIIDLSIKLEGLNVNFGMHACGKIIYPGDARADFPLMKDMESGIWKLQEDAETAEKYGLLKMDFLGLKNLNVITKTARLVYKNFGIKLDLLNLPEDKDVYKEVFSKGKTLAIFQFESAGMRNMLRKFCPESFSDLVLLVACYRPGPMQYLDGIIERKHGGKLDDESAIGNIVQIQDIVRNTYQAIVYQEQVQQIFRTLAGYSLGQADLVRRAMGHKKKDVLDKEKQAFLYGDSDRNIKGCEANGIDIIYASKLFEEMGDFAKYAFNKSHAAAYAKIAYITGYLKYHYPTEFYTSVLEFTDDINKYAERIAEAKDFGVIVHGPDIIKSSNKFTGKDNEIYFGFSGIKGIGGIHIKDRNFATFADFIATTDLGDKEIDTLVRCGAFDEKVKNRKAILEVLPDFLKEKEIIKKQNKVIDTYSSMLSDIENGIELDRKRYKITTKSLPTKAKLQEKVELSQKAIQEANNNLHQIVIPCEQVVDDIETNLETEKTLLGMYASGHPLDAYGTPQDYRCIPIADLEETPAKELDTIYGKVTKLKMLTQKKDRRDMCVFTLSDQTGEIDCCCFANSYELCGSNIREGAVVKLLGRKTLRKGEDDAFQFILTTKANAAVRIYDKKGSYYLSIPGIEEWGNIKSLALQYVVASGHPLFAFDEMTGTVYKTNLRVNESILKNRLFSIRIA